jgi:hypothetical protein
MRQIVRLTACSNQGWINLVMEFIKAGRQQGDRTMASARCCGIASGMVVKSKYRNFTDVNLVFWMQEFSKIQEHTTSQFNGRQEARCSAR